MDFLFSQNSPDSLSVHFWMKNESSDYFQDYDLIFWKIASFETSRHPDLWSLTRTEPGDSWVVTGIKPSNSQTASNLLTWLMAPNQYFTISLENLNTKNIHRSENWQNWGDFAAGSSFPVSVAGSQDGATAGTKWGFERKRGPRNIRGRVSASWWISPGQKIRLVKNIIYTSSQFINSTSLVAWFS